MRDAKMSDPNAIPAVRKGISSKNSSRRSVAKFKDRFSSREDPIVEIVKRELLHSMSHSWPI
jgi:hypothetical protein